MGSLAEDLLGMAPSGRDVMRGRRRRAAGPAPPEEEAIGQEEWETDAGFVPRRTDRNGNAASGRRATPGAARLSNLSDPSSPPAPTAMRLRSSLLPLAVALLAACVAAPSPSAAPAPSSDGIPDADRVRMAEAFRLSDQLGERIWPGWRRVPFAVLLVTPEREYLVRHPRPSADFAKVGHDALLGGDVYARPRIFSPSLQATFPAVSGLPTIVVGDAAHTGLRSTTWTLMLLHEHFHQLQTSLPGYFEGVDALRLARGDTTGMWMLNYPFPYDSAPVAARFADFTHAAAALIAEPRPARADERARSAHYADFLAARDRLRASLSSDDYRYLAFQLWQEGVARYTEYALARLAAQRYQPTPEFRALADYQPFDSAAGAILERITTGTRNPDLSRAKRVAFYPTGAAVALVLDDAAPNWRRDYLARPFSLDAYFGR